MQINPRSPSAQTVLLETLRGRARRAHWLLFLGAVCLLLAWLMAAADWVWLPPAPPEPGQPLGLHQAIWAGLAGHLEGMAQESGRAMRLVNGWLSVGLPGWMVWVPLGITLWVISLIDLALLAGAIRGHALDGGAQQGEGPKLTMPPVVPEPPTMSESPTMPEPPTMPKMTTKPPPASDPTPSIDAAESQLYAAEHQLETALVSLGRARHSLLNLSLDPDGPHRDDDLAKARETLDQAEQSLTRLRGQQHALIAGLVGLRRNVH